MSRRRVQEERTDVQGRPWLLLQRRVPHAGQPVRAHLGRKLACLRRTVLHLVQQPGPRPGQLRRGPQREAGQVHGRVSGAKCYCCKERAVDSAVYKLK